MAETAPRRSAHLALGRAGEEAAVAYLEKHGLRILERNWRPDASGASAHGLELDIVARDRRSLVFVEVKTRSGMNPSGFRPEHNFTPLKRRNLLAAVKFYLVRTGDWSLPCRVDLIAVTLRGGMIVRLEHYKDVLQFESGPRLPVGGSHTPWQPW